MDISFQHACHLVGQALEGSFRRDLAESLGSAKTKEVAGRFKALGLGSALIIDGEAVDENFAKAARNLPGPYRMRALKVKKFVGATYFTGPINDMFAKYFREAGFNVLGMEGLDVPFADVGQLSPYEVYSHVKKAFLKQPKADALYLLGSGWRVMEMIQPLEEDLGVPVIHPVPARVWEVQRRLHINEPKAGYGKILETMPPLPK